MAVAVTGQAKETDELYVKHPLPVSPFLPPLFAFLTRHPLPPFLLPTLCPPLLPRTPSYPMSPSPHLPPSHSLLATLPPAILPSLSDSLSPFIIVYISLSLSHSFKLHIRCKVVLHLYIIIYPKWKIILSVYILHITFPA